MSQLNLSRTEAFVTPRSGYKGIGFDSDGNPVMINGDGSTTPFLIEDDSGEGVVSNIMPNLGMGLESALPPIVAEGDQYVTTDTYKLYTAITTEDWSVKDLIKSQFITHDNIIWQYDGSTLIHLTLTPYEAAYASDFVYDCDLGESQMLTLTANLDSWSFTNVRAGYVYLLYIIQDATGGWTIPNPTGMTYVGPDSGKVFDLTANAVNIVKIRVMPNGDTFWSVVGNNPTVNDITLYIEGTSGNDVTGDGTSGNPYQTLLRAIEDVPPVCSNINITYQYNEAGTYPFGDAEKTALGSIQYSACFIFFKGIASTIEASVSFTEISSQRMLYNASKAGVTVAENDWRGYFLEDSGKYYPISYNSAGTDAFTVEYMRGSRNGTRNVVDVPVILDTSGTSDDEFLAFNFIGLPKITFELLTLNRPGDRVELTNLKAVIDWTWGLKWNVGDIILGQYSEHAIVNCNFTGNYFKGSSTSPIIDTRNGMDNINLTRCVVEGLSITTNSVVSVGKNSICELKEAAIIGGGSTSYAFALGRFGKMVLSKTVVIREVQALLSTTINENQFLTANYNNGYFWLELFGVSYLVNNMTTGSKVHLWNIEADGSFIHNINKANVDYYINEKYDAIIDIYGSYPERDRGGVSVPDSSTNQYEVVGSVADNLIVEIRYLAKRGTIYERGVLYLTNESNTESNREVNFGDVGLTIDKNINGDEIRLDITDTLTDGNATEIHLNIDRVLT